MAKITITTKGGRVVVQEYDNEKTAEDNFRFYERDAQMMNIVKIEIRTSHYQYAHTYGR